MGRKAQTASGQGLLLPSKRLLSFLCAAVLVLSTLPLYGISLYNHPYYDDYKFSADVHKTWLATGSLSAVAQTAWESAKSVRNTWQGTYTGTLLSNVQPGLFSESYYFLTTFLILTAFLLCFGFFLKTMFGDLLGMARDEQVILVSLTLTLLVQFMPDVGQAFFWFNGGIGNTFIYSLLALALGLLVKLHKTTGKGKAVWLTAALALLMVLLGGGSYGGGLFGLCLFTWITAWGFLRKNHRKWHFAALLLLFLACFLYNMSAPGNAVRAALLPTVSPSMAVIKSLYYGVALMGHYIRLPLLAVTGMLIPFFAAAAKRSCWRFSHPWLVLIGGVCLFCTQLTPPLFSGVGMGDGRIIDTYYQSFTIMWLLYAFYLTGWAVCKKEWHWELAPRTQRGLLIASVCALLVGCIGYKPDGEALYGVQNMAGASAAVSLLTGEAKQYHEEMTQREALLNDPALPTVTLAPLTACPDVFMEDLLVPDAIYDARPALGGYYDKEAIFIAGEETHK